MLHLSVVGWPLHMGKSHSLFSQKSLIIDVWQSFKYASVFNFYFLKIFLWASNTGLRLNPFEFNSKLEIKFKLRISKIIFLIIFTHILNWRDFHQAVQQTCVQNILNRKCVYVVYFEEYFRNQAKTKMNPEMFPIMKNSKRRKLKLKSLLNHEHIQLSYC